MLAGTRPSKTLASGYAKNPLRPYAESYVNTMRNIMTEGVDINMDPSRAMNNPASVEAMKEFFVNESYDPKGMTPEEIEEHVTDMEALFENDREAVLEHTNGSSIAPMVGLAFPMHKWILMNMVFDKGSIPKFVAQQPKFPITMEYRILVDTQGNELDFFKDQSKMTKAIDATAALTTFEVTLPLADTTEIVHDKLGGLAGTDHLSIETAISAVKVKSVFFEQGDRLPNDQGYVEYDGPICSESSGTTKDVWVAVNAPFTPVYGDMERALMFPFEYQYKKAKGQIETIKEILSGTMQNDRLNIVALKGKVTDVRITSRLDTSNARATTCSVKWKEKTDIVEIPNAIPINTTVTPEEVKDINAMYNINQVTKIMSMTKTVLANYKDDKILEALNKSYRGMDDSNSTYGTFDYAPREGYALDHVEWRYKTFLDYFETQVTSLLQKLNDPNMVISVYGDPDLVSKITPPTWTYQTPANIGPVELDYTRTVVSSSRRVYQFIGSDKLRGTTEFIIVLNPRGTERIMYRIYDYQLYISNEIRNADNPALPAIHSFERWKFVEYTPVQGRIQILNPSGINPERYNYISYKEVK